MNMKVNIWRLLVWTKTSSIDVLYKILSGDLGLVRMNGTMELLTGCLLFISGSFYNINNIIIIRKIIIFISYHMFDNMFDCY